MELEVILLGLWKTLVLLYDVITLPYFLLSQRPWLQLQKGNRTRATPVRTGDPYSTWQRTGKQPNVDAFFGKHQDARELYRMTFKTFAKQKCYGYRKVFNEEEEKQPNGKVFRKLIMDDQYTWISYEQADKEIEDLAAGLWSLGVKSGDRVVIIAETRLEWMTTVHALIRLGVTVATLYATLGDDGVVHGINEQEATHVITNVDLLLKMARLKSKIPKVNCIVYFENAYKKLKLPEFPDTRLVSYSQTLEEGHGLSNLPIAPIKPDDIAFMMYTSGSTGIPKAVMISHKNLLSASKAVLSTIILEMELKDDDIFLAYLPQAHIFELACELTVILVGLPIAYSSPQTMTDTSTAVKRGCIGDVSLVKPSLMPCVPLILDRIHKEVVNKIRSRNNRLLKGIFEFSLDYKTFWTRKGFQTPLINRFVFNKIKRMMGGRLRFLLVGGAPLSPETQEFAANCLDCRVYQGYAATECVSAGAVMDRYDLSYGRVGGPLYGVKLRLQDWREGGYYATDKPNPRGEVLIGGDVISKGYYKNEDETNKVYFEEDGIRWWATGDIVEVYPDGTLKIVDRKKDLVKLQHGEYISLGKVESILSFCDFVDNICVYGDSFHTNVIALIVPNRKALTELAAQFKKESLSFSDLCQDNEIIAGVKKAVAEHGSKSGLLRMEIPGEIKLCSEVWMPDNGLVTASFKVRRKQIQEFYKQDIIRLYNSNPSSKST